MSFTMLFIAVAVLHMVAPSVEGKRILAIDRILASRRPSIASLKAKFEGAGEKSSHALSNEDAGGDQATSRVDALRAKFDKPGKPHVPVLHGKFEDSDAAGGADPAGADTKDALHSSSPGLPISAWNPGSSQPDTLLNWNLCWECLSGEENIGSGKAVGKHCARILLEKSGSADPPAEWTQCTENMLTMMAEWDKKQSFRFALFQEGLTSDHWVPYFRERLGEALPALAFIFLEAGGASGTKTNLISGYDRQMGIPDAVFAINLSPGDTGDCTHSMDVRPAVGLVWQDKGVLVNIHNGRYGEVKPAINKCDPEKGWIYLMQRLQLAYTHCSSLAEDSETYRDQAYAFKIDQKSPKCWFSRKHQGAHFSVKDEILKGEIVLGGDSNNANFKETVGEMDNAKQKEKEVFGKELKGQKDNEQQKTCCMDKLESYEKKQASPQQWAKLEIGGEADKKAGVRYGDFVWTTSRVPHYLIAGSSGAEYLYDRPDTPTAKVMKELDSSLGEDDHFFMSDHDPTLAKM